jgi:2-methylcitrate dehydratase PrpD
MNKNFCEFIRTLSYQTLPADIIAIMKRSLLDTIGVGAIGSTTTISAITRQFAREHMPVGTNGPSARLLFDGRPVSPMGAAMAGAFTVDSIDAHDGYSAVKGHAGSGVLPGVLAIVDDLQGRGRNITGQELLTALAIGYEIAYRSGLAMHATCADYHTSGAWTAVGVAAAGAKLLGLDDDRLRHAMGIAEYHGPRSQMMRCIDFPSMVRDGVGWGAPSGVGAAYMAQIGFTGAPAITVEGKDETTRQFWVSLGENWEIKHTHYKQYPVCRWAHSSIDAADQLMQQHNLTSSDIERVRIRTFHYASRLAGHEPKTMDDLAYALAFPLAIMIVKRKIGAEELTEEILHDPETLRISKAIEIVDSDHYTKISTRKRWADVRLYLKDGREIQSAPNTPKGDPDDPLSDQEISAKFHMLAAPVIGKKRAAAIEQQVHQVDDTDFELEQLFKLILAANRSTQTGC